MEVCEADFNTCLVRSSNDIVSCFVTSSPDSFARTFWPVSVAALCALTYAIVFTYTGKACRQFVVSSLFRFHPQKCGVFHPNAATERQLDELILVEPERAAMMYRHHAYRDRVRRRRAQAQREAWWYRALYWAWKFLLGSCCCNSWRRRRSDDENDENNYDTNAPNNNNDADGDFAADTGSGPPAETSTNISEPLEPAVVVDHRPRLHLKTKRYCGAAHGEDEETPAAAAMRLFGRDTENVTLEEMDDEMEQGTRCAICLVRLKNGDVIGDIVCNHCMHKDCLKEWLGRNNRCPLCQHANVAALHQLPQSSEQC